MFKGMGNLGGLMEQASKMQADFKKLQEEAGKKTVEASSGGNMVKVVMTGKQTVVKLEIDPKILAMNDKAMLEDLVKVAVNQAVEASQKMVADEVGKLTQNLGPLASLLGK